MGISGSQKVGDFYERKKIKNRRNNSGGDARIWQHRPPDYLQVFMGLHPQGGCWTRISGEIITYLQIFS